MPAPADPTLSRVRIVVAILLLIITVLILLSIPHQRIHIDEAWLGEQAYWQATDGIRRSELFRGFLGYEDYMFVAHKGFIWVGSLAVRLAGWHLWALRLVPLLSGAVLLLALWYYHRLRDDEPAGSALPWALLFLLSAPLFFRYINLYRPEMPLAAVGFASFLLLARYIERGGASVLAAAGILAGVGVVIHLNGVIYIAAGLLTLAYLKRWRPLLAFGVVAAIVASLYFYDVIGHWDVFWYQFRSDPALDKRDLEWYAPFWRLVNEHKRLFRKPEVIFASTLFFTSLWYYWRSAPRSRRWVAVYAVGAVVGLGAFAQGKTVAYTVLLLPSAAIVIGASTAHWLSHWRQTSRALSRVAVALWMLFLGQAFFDNTRFALTGKRDVAATNRQAAQFIPPGATVLAPLDFVFEEIGNYRIRGDEAAAWIMKLSHPDIGDIHKSVHAPDFLSFAREQNLDAVILENHLFTRIRMRLPDVGDTLEGFVVAGKVTDPDRTILCRTD